LQFQITDGLWRTDWDCVTPLPFVCKAVAPKAYINPDDRGEFKKCNETHGWYSTETHEEQGYYCIKAFNGGQTSFYEGFRFRVITSITDLFTFNTILKFSLNQIGQLILLNSEQYRDFL